MTLSRSYFEREDRKRCAVAFADSMRGARWQQQHTVRESVAELESARSENVKVESDGAALRDRRTAASFSGIKQTHTYTHKRHSHTARTGALFGFSIDWKYSLFIFFIFLFNIFVALSLALFTLSWIDWEQCCGEWGASFTFTWYSFLMTQIGRSKVLREDLLSLYGIILDEGALF